MLASGFGVSLTAPLTRASRTRHVRCSGGLRYLALRHRAPRRLACRTSPFIGIAMTTIFVDTNFLLHARPLPQIKWEERHELPVILVIAPTNIKELDKHKDQHPKKHLRDRARKALQLIEAATKHATIRVGTTLVIVNRANRIEFADYGLDSASADDALIASILAYRVEHPDEVIVLYTHDVGPRLTAQRLGIRALAIPDEELLPPEKDAIEQENERLRKELHEFKAASPQLYVTINESTDVVVASTMEGAPESLDDAAVQRQAAAAQDKLPIVTRGN